MKATTYVISIIVFAVMSASSAQAFGPTGHRLVGQIADDHLSPEAKKQVATLLKGDLGADGKPSNRKTLAAVASWADEIRGKPAGKGNEGWHFIDLPICGTVDMNTVCPGGNCAPAQITRALDILKDSSATLRARNEALKWIVHLMGDIHQPLHTADHDDKGGNDVKVSFLGKARSGSKTLNLHSIWDTDIVERMVGEVGGETAFVHAAVKPEDVATWEEGTLDDWIQESHAIAETFVYAQLPDGVTCGEPITQTEAIDSAYYDQAAPRMATQLWRGGIRLAKVLNVAFGGEATPSSELSTTTTLPGDTTESTATNEANGIHMPDPSKTPGHATYHTATTLCAMGSTKDERNVPDAEKTQVYANYGIDKCQGYCSGPQGCEIDHLISLELGGANTEDNLWPQPYDGDWNAHDKDKLENKLHEMVCKDKSIALADAQREIATDWVAAFKKYVGTRTPFKPVVHCPK